MWRRSWPLAEFALAIAADSPQRSEDYERKARLEAREERPKTGEQATANQQQEFYLLTIFFYNEIDYD